MRRLAGAFLGALLVSGCSHAAPAPGPAVPRTQDAKASRSRPLTVVRALGTLREPDLLVTTAGRFTTDRLRAVDAVPGVRALAVLARGRVRVNGALLNVVAVDPSAARAFTPRETASSDPLWAAVARGDLAASYGVKLPLGATVPVGIGSLRVGALAAFGLPDADAVVSREVGQRLGLVPDAVLLAAPGRSLELLEKQVRRALPGPESLTVLRPAALQHRRPKTYEELYKLSARYCPGLSWKVLAAIGQVESGHGRNVGPSSAGALGPMQFLPSTWAFAGVDGDGDGRADIMSAYDAVPAAALYLCRAGAGHGGRGLYAAIYSYNHADWYVREVLALAARY